MNSLRLRVELNKGGIGIPLDQLGNIVKKTRQFLAAASKDIGFEGDPGNWVAQNFKDGSVIFDCCRLDEQGQDVMDHGYQVLKNVMENDLSDPELNLRISYATRIQYAKISDAIAPNETVSLGLYRNDKDMLSKQFELTKESASKIMRMVPQVATYYGEIQGIVHAFYKESRHPRLAVREKSTNVLVDCFFKPELYQEAVEMLREPSAVIFVEGEVAEDRESGLIKSIKVAKFHIAPDFDEALFERFIGSRPDYTGKLTTEEFIEMVRGDD